MREHKLQKNKHPSLLNNLQVVNKRRIRPGLTIQFKSLEAKFHCTLYSTIIVTWQVQEGIVKYCIDLEVFKCT